MFVFFMFSCSAFCGGREWVEGGQAVFHPNELNKFTFFAKQESIFVFHPDKHGSCLNFEILFMLIMIPDGKA